MSMAHTLFDKIWQQHLVDRSDDGSALIYIDGQLLHEVTSPQGSHAMAVWANHEQQCGRYVLKV